MIGPLGGGVRCRGGRLPLAVSGRRSAAKVDGRQRRRHREVDRQQGAVLQRRGQDVHPSRTRRSDAPQGEEGLRARSWLQGMEQGYVALYQKCPHLGCRVPWCQTSQWFECPCHGSKYNRVGEKRGGPAPRGMDRFALEVERQRRHRRHEHPHPRTADRHRHHRPGPRGRAVRVTTSRRSEPPGDVSFRPRSSWSPERSRCSRSPG